MEKGKEGKGNIKKPLLYTTFWLVVTVQDFLKRGEMLVVLSCDSDITHPMRHV